MTHSIQITEPIIFVSLPNCSFNFTEKLEPCEERQFNATTLPVYNVFLNGASKVQVT